MRVAIEMKGKDLILRFILGGTAVMLSYILSHVLPWKEFGGIFAAFPAVMVVAVMMMGITNGSKKAAQVAQGAVYGMLGGVVCVLSVLVFIQTFHNWWVSILLGLVCWYLSALITSRFMEKVKQKSAFRGGNRQGNQSITNSP